MGVVRHARGVDLVDVLDRVLDKGVVIDAWMRVALGGIELVTVEARVVVASIDTYLTYADAVTFPQPVARPAFAPHRAAAALPPNGRTPGAWHTEWTRRS